MKLFLNADNKSYLRGMEKDFGESTNAIRLELNRMAEAGLINSEMIGVKKVYRANRNHPLFKDINNILKKTVGIDKLVEKVTSQIGNLEYAYLIGSFAEGLDSEMIELVLVGSNLDKNFIADLIEKAEKMLSRGIVHIIIEKRQMEHFLREKNSLLIWQKDKS